MAAYLTFEEIYQTVMKAIADKQYARADEVKAVVNMVYLNEVMNCDDLYPFFWLYETDDEKKSKAPVTAVTSITKATPPTVTSIAHGLITGDIVTGYDMTGMTELNYRTFHVTRATADTFTLQDLSHVDIPAVGYVAAGTAGKFHHRGTEITDCKSIIEASWHGYNDEMKPISPNELAKQATWHDISTGLPKRRFHRKVYTSDGEQYDYLLWYHGADAAYNLHIQYEIQVNRLESAGDIPIGPAQVAYAIIAGSVMRLGENTTQVEAGVIWPQIYKISLDAIRTINRQWWKANKPSERSGLFLA